MRHARQPAPPGRMDPLPPACAAARAGARALAQIAPWLPEAEPARILAATGCALRLAVPRAVKCAVTITSTATGAAARADTDHIDTVRSLVNEIFAKDFQYFGYPMIRPAPGTAAAASA